MTTYPSPPSGRLLGTPHGRRLTVQRSFRAPIEDVWASLTEPERLARWFGEVEGVLAPGSTIAVTMTAEEGSPTVPARILECTAPTRLVVEISGMSEPWRVVLDLSESGGLTTLTLTHVLTDDLDAGDVGAGWEFYADRHHAAWVGHPLPDWTADRYRELVGPHYADTDTEGTIAGTARS